MSRKKILFEDLRRWRLVKAREENLPAYCIFNNKTFHDICDLLPTCESELLHIRGVGEKNLQKYGRELLDIIFCHISEFDNLVKCANKFDHGIVEIAETLSRSIGQTESQCALLESARMAVNRLIHSYCGTDDGSGKPTESGEPPNPVPLSTHAAPNFTSDEDSEVNALDKYNLTNWISGEFQRKSPVQAQIIRKNLLVWGPIYEGVTIPGIDPQIVGILRGDDDVDVDASDPNQLAALFLHSRLENDIKGPKYVHEERRQQVSNDQAWAESRRRQLKDSWGD